jgi:uncharacterized protein (TIGR02284 family)
MRTRAFERACVENQSSQEALLNNDIVDHLKSLHTSAIDARNGYQEALKDADGKGMTPLFREMIALHQRHADELASELRKADEIPDEKGSFMSVIHETIMDVRSMFNGLDESVLPGLIDGEKRNVSKYDDALKAVDSGSSVAGLLSGQCENILRKIAGMEAQKSANERAV